MITRMRTILLCCHLCVFVLFAGGAALGAEEKELPSTFLIKKGQKVLLLGDSIVAPGMFSYVINTLLDRLYPGNDITFYSYGKAGATAQSILPDVAKAFKDHSFDWVIINFGHNDANKYSADEFKQTYAPALLREVRKYHKGEIGWTSILGSEPSPHQKEKRPNKRNAGIFKTREKQLPFINALKRICNQYKLHYLGLHEAMDCVLADRQNQRFKICFTMDTVHPNLPGNWLVGALLLQSLGLEPKETTIEVLPGNAFTDHGQEGTFTLQKPMLISLPSCFLSIKLIPPRESTVVSVFRNKPVVLDGMDSDWEGIKSYEIGSPLNVTWELRPRCCSKGNYSASLQSCYDNKNLYFLIKVNEPDLGKAAWFDELIEIFIDARKDRKRSGNVWRRTPGLTQFLFSRDFSGKYKTNVKAWANGDKEQGKNIQAVAKKTRSGYMVEAAIPLNNFKQIDLLKENRVPFDWAVSFSDQILNFDWQGLMSRSQSTFSYGWLQFGGK